MDTCGSFHRYACLQPHVSSSEAENVHDFKPHFKRVQTSATRIAVLFTATMEGPRTEFIGMLRVATSFADVMQGKRSHATVMCIMQVWRGQPPQTAAQLAESETWPQLLPIARKLEAVPGGAETKGAVLPVFSRTILRPIAKTQQIEGCEQTTFSHVDVGHGRAPASQDDLQICPAV